ncbi:uL13 family ribosomal protein, partial [Pseudomonas syringae group genomosp. 7]|uniref:uL13 family ribosomal protein n=1 Tax=Pseudomonas syringae group genomosp. 7 TaxID=251699 RepID=UPI00376F7E52
SINFENRIAKAPELVIETSVKGMLPKNPLGRDMYSKLKVYAGAVHPHTAHKTKKMKN